MSIPRNALVIVTSHADLGETGRKTGFYFDEMAKPYWGLVDAGYAVDIASPKGGAAPYDLGSFGEVGKRSDAVQRFIDDAGSMAKIGATIPISAIDPTAYNAVFLPGGHGTMWDFTEATLADVVGKAWDHGAVIGAVCQGPAGLIRAKRADGTPLVSGLKLNAFTDAEEVAVGLTDVVPFLLETELRKLGAHFESAGNFQPFAVRDGRLVTGQNPKSAQGVTELMLEALSEKAAAAAH
jgi:putative intracellular protease/amidase